MNFLRGSTPDFECVNSILQPTIIFTSLVNYLNSRKNVILKVKFPPKKLKLFPYIWIIIWNAIKL